MLTATRSRLTYLLAAVLFVTGIQSCGSSGGTDTGGGGAIALSLSISSATIAPGGQFTVVGTIARTGGFTGDVAIAVTGTPAGVTGSPGTVTTNGTTSSAIVTIAAATSTAPGTYSLTVTASGNGVTKSTATFTLTVSATAQSYSLSVAPTGATIAAGSTGTATVTINRSGFSGSVNLSVPNLPAGFTATFSPNNTTGTTSTMTVTVAASVTTGLHQLTIGGVASGQPDQIASFAVTVSGGGGGGGSGNAVLNFSACAANLKPQWLAYQDGAGAWTVVTGSNDVYQFAITQSKGGFAYVNFASGTQTQMSIVYYTKAELTTAPLVFCPPQATNTMTGTLAGMSAQQQAAVSMGNAAALTAFPATAFTLNKMSAGSFDLLAYRTSVLGAPSANDRVIVRRNQQVINQGVIPVIDFGSAEAVAPASGTINVTGAAGGQVSAQMTYYSSNCATSGLLYFILNPASTFTAYGVPAASQQASDFHNLIVGASVGSAVFGAQEVFHTLGNRTVAMPTAVGAPVVTSLAGNYKRLQAVYTLPSDYNSGTSVLYYDVTASHYVSITATTGYLGSAAVTLAMPVFSGLAGFLDSWPPATAQAVTWGVQAIGSNVTTTICQEGGRTVNYQVSGTG